MHLPTNHTQEYRRRTTIDCSIETAGGGADQSSKKQCDINNIMAHYAKTGMLPNMTTAQPQFIDNTLIPDLNTAFEITNRAIEQFKELPPNIRKLMDNNPANLEHFVRDPKNADVLIKAGILLPQITPEREITLKDIHETLKQNQKPTEPV